MHAITTACGYGSWLSPGRRSSVFSLRNQIRHLAIGGALARRETGRHPGTIRGAAVLAHLALAFDARDRQPQADDGAELRGNELLRRIRHGPRRGARGAALL